MTRFVRNKVRVTIDEDKELLTIFHTLGGSLMVDVSWRGRPRPWIIPSGVEVQIKPSFWRENDTK